jgi:HK97 gp10 family phage protein
MPAFGTVEVRFNKVPQLSGNLRKLAKEAVEAAALQTEAIAKPLAPVDTGALRNSIQAMKGDNDLTWVVNVGQEYGIFQEYGTVHQAAHPFMTPAVEIVRPQFMAAMGDIVEQAAR